MKLFKALTVSTLIWTHLVQAGMAQKPAGAKEFDVEAPFQVLEQKLELSNDLIEELRPFANNLKRKLDRVLETAAEYNSFEAENHIVMALRQILAKENRRLHEMLAIEILERALLIHEVLLEETNKNSTHDAQVRIRLLTRAIELVRQKYFQKDQAFLNDNSEVEFARFGNEYFEYLTNLNKSVFDATAQYRIEKLSLQFLAYDLARDVSYQTHATSIVEISDSLIGFPKNYVEDQDAIIKVRALRKIKKNVLNTMDKSYELIGRNVFIKAPLLSGDHPETIYTGTIKSIESNQELQIEWTRRNGHALRTAYRQSHPRTEIVFNKKAHEQLKLGQIVSMFDFHENGTRFTRTGRLIEMFENGTASVLWTHTSAFSNANANSITLEEHDNWNSYVPLSQLK